MLFDQARPRIIPGALVLAAILMIWQPANFSAQLTATLPTIGYRGIAAVAELLLHGAVAAFSAAAGFALWMGRPHGPALAAAALIAGTAISVQSLYFSMLPNSTMPGDELPIAFATIAHAAAWLVYLSRSERIHPPSP
jgi:hypothetical protein